MLADPRYRHGIVGKSREELSELLGPPHEATHTGRSDASHWDLCPSFLDIFILEVRWQDDRAVEVQVLDT